MKKIVLLIALVLVVAGSVYVYRKATAPVVYENNPNDFKPSFSPDGTRILFYSYRHGNPQIYVMDADGANPVRVTNTSRDAFFPSWSPDGSRLLFCSDRDGFLTRYFKIYGVQADGSGLVRVAGT